MAANFVWRAYEEAQRIIRISDEVRISLERVTVMEQETAAPAQAPVKDPQQAPAPTEPTPAQGEKLTTSKMAQKLGIKTGDVLDRACAREYVLRHGEKLWLSAKGEACGVEFVAKSRFGPYFLWPQNIDLS